MDIQAEKYTLIEYITQITDRSKIEKLKQFVKANDQDFWNDLTQQQKTDVVQGWDELDNGQRFEYESVLSKHRK